eukprot:SAG11_NODE_7503_length_1136_cov_1.815815_2_plen_223_part_01
MPELEQCCSSPTPTPAPTPPAPAPLPAPPPAAALAKKDEAVEALAKKDEGNTFFKAGQTEEAIAAYTAAIALLPRPDHPEASKIYGNRAACHKNLGDHDKVIADCSEVRSGPVSSRVFVRKLCRCSAGAEPRRRELESGGATRLRLPGDREVRAGAGRPSAPPLPSVARSCVSRASHPPSFPALVVAAQTAGGNFDPAARRAAAQLRQQIISMGMAPAAAAAA